MKNIENINMSYQECSQLLPRGLEFESIIPNAQLSLIYHFTQGQVEKIFNESKIEIHSLAFLCACRSYLQTQYYYTKRLTPIIVDIEKLKEKFLEHYSFRVELYFPQELDYLLSIVSEGLKYEVLNNGNINLNKMLNSSSSYESKLSDLFYLNAAIGSLVWQMTEQMSTENDNINPNSVPKVFISYSTKDKLFVNKIEKQLNKVGIKTWRDEKDIKIGEPILNRIKDGIWKECDFILIIISSNSVNSGWCKMEIQMAYEKEIENEEIFVLPILIDNCSVPKELSIKKYINLSKNYQRNIKQLIDSILFYNSLRLKTTSKAP